MAMRHTEPRAIRKSPLDVHIGGRISARRKEMDLRHEELAFLAETDVDSIRKFETGELETTAFDIFYLAKALGVSIEYFFVNIPKACELEPRGTESRTAVAHSG